MAHRAARFGVNAIVVPEPPRSSTANSERHGNNDNISIDPYYGILPCWYASIHRTAPCYSGAAHGPCARGAIAPNGEPRRIEVQVVTQEVAGTHHGA